MCSLSRSFHVSACSRPPEPITRIFIGGRYTIGSGRGLSICEITLIPWVYNDRMGSEVIPKLTHDQFRQLPDDGKRYELIRGEVHLTPAPTTRHQFTLRNLSVSLVNYLATNPLGEVAFAPLDVLLEDDTALQPDLIFVSNARAKIIHEAFVEGAPDLVVEILSTTTAAHDRATKL